jgi:hypothetical protein
MSKVFAPREGGSRSFAGLFIMRTVVMLLPATLLAVASLRAPGPNKLMLWLGAAFQLLVCSLSFLSRQSWRQPLGPSVITLYVIGLGWLWLGSADIADWYPHLAQAVLLVVPVIVFSHQMLNESGVSALRRARLLAQRLAQRKEWPPDLASCRTLPEVKALREAMYIDASPALGLLNSPKPQVRIAALGALEFRKNWRRGQAEIVLHQAQAAPEAPVRAAAIAALANVDDRPLIEALAEFLRDPALEVRRVTAEALLWNSENRWPWIRIAVRRYLTDPIFRDDGPLLPDGQQLTAEAVTDLTAWAAEKGIIGIRSALTLGAHYNRALTDGPDSSLVPTLQQQLANPHAPPALRMELAWLLQNGGELSRELLEKLIDPANPAPLRLIAVEALLADAEHGEALAALRDLARLPNREIALATANVVQRRLGVDMGLALGQPLPPIHTRQAAEVARRVMNWAAQHDQPLPA